jgi:hypothetical protein
VLGCEITLQLRRNIGAVTMVVCRQELISQVAWAWLGPGE